MTYTPPQSLDLENTENGEIRRGDRRNDPPSRCLFTSLHVSHYKHVAEEAKQL